MSAWLRSPLLHFLVLGAVLFAVDRARTPATPAAAPIVVGAARIAQLRDEYTRATGLAPTPADERALVTHAVDDELLYRDALARGLDRDDRSIRWQLVEKMSFLDGRDEYDTDRDASFARALALGLDRDDPVIRRMLIEKVRLLVKDAAAREPVGDDELRDWLARHPDAWRRPVRLDFRHVFFSSTRRDDAARVLAALRAAT